MKAARESGAGDRCQAYEMSLDPSEIRSATRQVLKSKDRPEAIFAASNIAAKGIIPLLVLPFSASGEGTVDARLLAEMITDDLTNVLSRAPTFRVAAPAAI